MKMLNKIKKICEACAAIGLSSLTFSSLVFYGPQSSAPSSEDTGNSSDFFSENPEILLGLTIFGPSFSGSTSTSEKFDKYDYIDVWVKDSVPYSAIEKRALTQYNCFRNKKINITSSPFVKVDSEQLYNEILQYFDKKELEKTLEHIEAVERALKESDINV